MTTTEAFSIVLAALTFRKRRDGPHASSNQKEKSPSQRSNTRTYLLNKRLFNFFM